MRELNRDTPSQNHTTVMFLHVVFFTLQRREVHPKEGTSSDIFTPLTLPRVGREQEKEGEKRGGEDRERRGAPRVGSHPHVRNPEKYLGYQLSKAIGLI